MAVKIIVNKYRHTAYRATCTSCRSVLEFTDADVKRENDRDGQFWRFKCPACGAMLFISPAAVRTVTTRKPKMVKKKPRRT